MPTGLSYFGTHVAASGLGSMVVQQAVGASTRGSYGIAKRIALGGAGWVNRNPKTAITLGVGTLAGATTLGVAAEGTYRAARNMGRQAEAEQMARMILSAQSGPYGPSGRLLGMGANSNGTAGLSLAAHYAQNRNKHFGVMGLRFL